VLSFYELEVFYEKVIVDPDAPVVYQEKFGGIGRCGFGRGRSKLSLWKCH
jgi:hypothetical protein